MRNEGIADLRFAIADRTLRWVAAPFNPKSKIGNRKRRLGPSPHGLLSLQHCIEPCLRLLGQVI